MATNSFFNDYFYGLKLAIPVMLGYLPIAISFGVLAIQSGLPLLETIMMSVFIYAGASQFMGLNMFALGVASVEIVLATFILNFRHFVMSLSLFSRMNEVSKRWKIPLAHGITDEIFALATFNEKRYAHRKTAGLFVGMFSGAWIVWVIGTFIGALLGNVVPPALSASMGIALYALFIGLLVPAIRANPSVAAIAVGGGVVCALSSSWVSEGWAIVIGTIGGATIGISLLSEEEE